MTPASGLAGLVLAGGRSRRFGAEKALASYGGRPLLAAPFTVLTQVCGRVAVSARPGSGAETLALAWGAPVLRDHPGHPEGPMAGVAAGLAWARAAGAEILAVLPCDTPDIDADAVLSLIKALGPTDGAAMACTPDGPQPLCAALRVAAGGALADRLAGGDHPSARAGLALMGLREVMFGAERFRNVNTPQDALLAHRVGGRP